MTQEEPVLASGSQGCCMAYWWQEGWGRRAGVSSWHWALGCPQADSWGKWSPSWLSTSHLWPLYQELHLGPSATSDWITCSSADLWAMINSLCKLSVIIWIDEGISLFLPLDACKIISGWFPFLDLNSDEFRHEPFPVKENFWLPHPSLCNRLVLGEEGSEEIFQCQGGPKLLCIWYNCVLSIYLIVKIC